jgi:hypothetical protein
MSRPSQEGQGNSGETPRRRTSENAPSQSLDTSHQLFGVGTRDLGPLATVPARALRVVLCVLVAALVFFGDLQAALIVAVFVGLSFAHLLRSDRRPAFFDVLFALAALVGAVGFAFGLFDEIVPYDELTHAFTTFCVSLTFYFLFYSGARAQAVCAGDLGVHPGGHRRRLLGNLRVVFRRQIHHGRHHKRTARG